MKNPVPNERALIERAAQRDEPAFADLVEACTPMLYRIVRRMVTDTMEAESIVQETFWRFWRTLPRYQADRPLLPYLAAIASNLARDHYRRERWIESADMDEKLENIGDSGLNIEEHLDREKILEDLARAIELLPFAYRSVVSLRYDAEMSYEEIALALSLPLNTVRTHLRRAKQILRAQVKEMDHG
jgi:RNA polymerase sigma-70 factor (ECF subfamily)